MAAPETGSAAWPGRLPGGGSTVSVIVATAIVVADMVGVGVFTSLGFQVKDIPSGFSILLLWTVGGIVALCGVFSYSELGAMFPRSSGEYNFLSRAFHPAFGFLAGWVSATVGFAAPVALAAMAFGEYGKSVLPGAPPLALAIGVVWLVSIVQLTGVRHSSTFQLVSTILKVVLIVAFLIAGFVVGTPQPVSFAPHVSDFGHVTSAPFAIGLVFVMYSFSGWNAATYIIGEMRMPQQNLPRALLAGTLIVLVLYVALNAVFLHTTPIDKLSGQLDVARIAGSTIFGEIGGRIVGAMICIGLVSSISAMMWIGPRVMMTMGEDIPALAVFARKSSTGRAGLRHPFPARGRQPDAVHPQFRGGAGFHPVRAAVLLVLHRAWRHQAAHHEARSAAALSRLGIPGHPGRFPARDAVHDVLSFDGTAIAVVSGYFDYDFGPFDLCHFPQADRCGFCDRIPGPPIRLRIEMLQPLKIAALAAAMLFALALPGRAAETVTANDTARFLAGMPPSAESPLTPLTKDPAWQRHARFFDSAFAQLEQRQLSKIRGWADANLAAPRPTMFYMFSGPDFLYANAFYSKATTYVLSALEPPGSVPDLTKLPRGGLGAALYDVEHSMGSILSFSFFITKQMKLDLRAGQVSGTLPILYVFLARSGKTIRDVSLVALDDKGAAHFANENAGRNATHGVRIIFAGSDGEQKDAVLFLHRSFQQRRQERRLPEILRDARARQQPDQERVLSAACRQFLHGARFPARQQRHHHPGRFRHSARRLRSEGNGGSFRSAAMPVRSPNSPADTSRNMPSCSGAASRWISASAIAGGRMNRTCCCRSGLPAEGAGSVDATARSSRFRRPPGAKRPQDGVDSGRFP